MAIDLGNNTNKLLGIPMKYCSPFVACHRVISLMVIMLHGFQLAPCQEPSSEKPLKVISYNVQFLPGPAAFMNKRPAPEYRAQTIGRLMSDYDIVGLNELFDDKPKEILISEIRRSWGEKASVFVSPKVAANRFTGGLAILSHLPFVETNFHTYTQSSSPEKYGLTADGFATKGVLHARIALSEISTADEAIDVFVTHLEAREPAIRPSQYAEFAEFVKLHTSASRPAIFLGDFNTRGGNDEMQNSDSAYNAMLKTFASAQPESTLTDLWPSIGEGFGGTSDQLKEDGGRRIDYVFTLNPKQTGAQLIAQSIAVNRFLDKKVVALSDHSAVEATLQWKKGRTN